MLLRLNLRSVCSRITWITVETCRRIAGSSSAVTSNLHLDRALVLVDGDRRAKRRIGSVLADRLDHVLGVGIENLGRHWIDPAELQNDIRLDATP